MSHDYVALLGTKGGPAIRPGSSMPTANLICLNGRQIVVDCGLGVTRAFPSARASHVRGLSHLTPSDDPDQGPQDCQDAIAGHREGPLFVGRDGIGIDV